MAAESLLCPACENPCKSQKSLRTHILSRCELVTAVALKMDTRLSVRSGPRFTNVHFSSVVSRLTRANVELCEKVETLSNLLDKVHFFKQPSFPIDFDSPTCSKQIYVLTMENMLAAFCIVEPIIDKTQTCLFQWRERKIEPRHHQATIGILQIHAVGCETINYEVLRIFQKIQMEYRAPRRIDCREMALNVKMCIQADYVLFFSRNPQTASDFISAYH